MFVSVESKDFVLKIRRTEVWIVGYRLWHYIYVYLLTCNKYNWDELLQIVQVIGECDEGSRFSTTQPCHATLYTILTSWRQAFRRFLTSSVARQVSIVARPNNNSNAVAVATELTTASLCDSNSLDIVRCRNFRGPAVACQQTIFITLTIVCHYTDNFEPRYQSCENWVLRSSCLSLSVRISLHPHEKTNFMSGNLIKVDVYKVIMFSTCAFYQMLFSLRIFLHEE